MADYNHNDSYYELSRQEQIDEDERHNGPQAPFSRLPKCYAPIPADIAAFGQFKGEPATTQTSSFRDLVLAQKQTKKKEVEDE